MKKYFLQCTLILATAAYSSCGVKRYEEPLRCDDLPTFFYTERDASTLSDEQLAAVERFESLQGDWQAAFTCIDGTDLTAQIRISEALGSNVELYDISGDAECESFGKAVFEAQISDSGDMDLDDTSFTLTADLMIPDSFSGNLLEAASDHQLSQYPDTQTFSLQVVINGDGEFVATKEVTLTSNSGGNVTVTQMNECFLTDWVAQ